MRMLRLVLLLGALCMPVPVLAQEAPNPLPDFRHRSWYDAVARTILLGGATSAIETGTFLMFFGGNSAMASTVFAASVLSSAATYVAYEVGWDALFDGRWHPEDPEAVAAKASTWRVTTALRSFAIGNVLGSGGAAVSALYAGSVAVAGTMLRLSVDLATLSRPTAAP